MSAPQYGTPTGPRFDSSSFDLREPVAARDQEFRDPFDDLGDDLGSFTPAVQDPVDPVMPEPALPAVQAPVAPVAPVRVAPIAPISFGETPQRAPISFEAPAAVPPAAPYATTAVEPVSSFPPPAPVEAPQPMQLPTPAPVVAPVTTAAYPPSPTGMTLAPAAPSPSIAPVVLAAPRPAGVPVAVAAPVVQSGPVLPPAATSAGVTESEAPTIDYGDDLDRLLKLMIEMKGSDLHLSPGSQPRIRVRGELMPVEDTEILSDDALRGMVNSTLDSGQKTVFETKNELNFSYQIPGAGRFRGNLMMRDGAYAAVYRMIPWKIATVEELGLPAVLTGLADLHRGLVLVTGATGSGKSTTLAAILDRANRTRNGHILTIEDPVEFRHEHKRSVVNQREVGPDTDSFAEALRNALRQDPDIILVGEMRDLETTGVALTAAETGHLVLATLHTQSAEKTVSRIIDQFPSGQQSQVRTQLAATLVAVVCQTLCKTLDGKGRVAATEVMFNNHAVGAAIRDDKLHQIPNSIQMSKNEGMHTLAMNLVDLIKSDTIGAVEAAEKAYNKRDLAVALGVDADRGMAAFEEYEERQRARLRVTQAREAAAAASAAGPVYQPQPGQYAPPIIDGRGQR